MEPAPALQSAPQHHPLNPDFLAFSESHFQTWVAAGASNHPVWFHKCCFSFSTYKKRPKLKHPAEEAEPLQRFLKKHKVENPHQFASLLLDLSSARPAEQAGRLPTINEPHHQPLNLGKREPAGEVEALQQQVAAQQATIEQLQQQLEVERAAAFDGERKFLSQKYLMQLAKKECWRNSWVLPLIAYTSISQQAAAGFQAAYDDIPTFGNVPRPQRPNPPGEQPHEQDYDELTTEFLSPYMKGYLQRIMPR